MENTLRTETHFRLLRPPGGGAFWLALLATSTALSLSILSGWQRAGTLPERIVWVAIGVVLVVSAHLLPALIRDAPAVVRGIGSLLWAACLATACYGHAVFFIFAQQHAGDRRAVTVGAPPPAPARSLTVVMANRSVVIRQLAWANARHCSRDCTWINARRVTLAAKLDALNAEASDVRRVEAERDRVTAQRDALRADPVASRLATLLGMTTARVDLLSGLAFAAVLEGVACLLWTVALRQSSLPAVVPVATDSTLPIVMPVTPATDATQPVVTSVVRSHADQTVSRNAVTDRHVGMPAGRAPRDDPIPAAMDNAQPDHDVTQLVADIAAGHLRPTVVGIRRHLGCSQSRAIVLRRQLAGLATTA
ncbi:hypothetical protein [Paraburkholderia kururiensis]|uniref:hypothetical protein n=1 Tax=Paraburkholderia kururiensis TaxID=984307 RepID=UPI0005A91402|nr:hypothetical protein [Paraburkholderia kururiensis]